MTTNEILQASLLDILFDNRNKNYGAYALRKDYNHRLLAATVTALTAAILLFTLISFGRKKSGEPKAKTESGPLVIRKVIFPPEKLQPLKAISKPAPKTASAKLVSNLVITKDFLVKQTEIPEINDLANKDISNVNVSGPPSDGITRSVQTTNTGSESTGSQNAKTDFKVEEREPEFPGGQEALIRFLRNNLNTPDDLQAGESKTVHIRFIVGAEGLVSNLEIVQSGGSEFDREVIRVCKKMPRWKPAFQNGSYVAVSYVLPVTFLGVEQ